MLLWFDMRSVDYFLSMVQAKEKSEERKKKEKDKKEAKLAAWLLSADC